MGRLSLAIPRPGKGLTDKGTPRTATDPKLPPPASNPSIELRVRYKPVPGSLERLRVHTSYAFRARAVDLAGNSLSVSEADALIDAGVAGDAIFQTERPLLPLRAGQRPASSAPAGRRVRRHRRPSGHPQL